MAIFDNKTILVTGATGLICSKLIKFLMDHTRAKVYALARSREKLRELFGKYEENRLIYIEQDVSEEILISDHIDYIFHGAGPIDSKTISEKPVSVIMPNIQGLMNCCHVSLNNSTDEQKCRLIVFSSATVYGNITEQDIVVSEEDTYGYEKINSKNACYSESKRMAEVITRAMCFQYGLDAVIVRFSYVYGGTFFRPNTAFYQFLDAVKDGNNIVMNNSGLQRRDNIYIDDAISGLIKVVEKGITGEAYNISSGGEGGNFAAIDEIATIMINVVNENKKEKLFLEYRKEAIEHRRSPGIILSNKKLKTLGWKPQVDLETGIRKIMKEEGMV